MIPILRTVSGLPRVDGPDPGRAVEQSQAPARPPALVGATERDSAAPTDHQDVSW